jgi:hypothetical protein
MDKQLRELIVKWRNVGDRYFNLYSNAPAPADRRDFGLSDAYMTCSDELEAALAIPSEPQASEPKRSMPYGAEAARMAKAILSEPVAGGDNPFEPGETPEQLDRRIGKMIRDTVDKRLESENKR